MVYKIPIDEELLKIEYNENLIEYFVCGGKNLTFSFSFKYKPSKTIIFKAGGIEW